jgi:hypothetical protein
MNDSEWQIPAAPLLQKMIKYRRIGTLRVKVTAKLTERIGKVQLEAGKTFHEVDLPLVAVSYKNPLFKIPLGVLCGSLLLTIEIPRYEVRAQMKMILNSPRNEPAMCGCFFLNDNSAHPHDCFGEDLHPRGQPLPSEQLLDLGLINIVRRIGSLELATRSGASLELCEAASVSYFSVEYEKT